MPGLEIPECLGKPGCAGPELADMRGRRSRLNSFSLVALASALTFGCEPATESVPSAPVGAEPSSAALENQVLARTGYGPDAWSQARIEAIGVAAYIDEQLAPATLPDPMIDVLLATRPTLSLGYEQLLAAYPLDGDRAAIPLLELIEMKILRSVHSRRQLEQVLVDFWFDHFNVFAVDAITLHAVVPYERDAIRPHVLGRFEDMLRAVARSPAMLHYLDNDRSTREAFVFMGESRGLNENFARELLELHTIGGDGGFDQQDVIEVARAFTGWTIGPPALAEPGGFLFWNAAHDADAKSLMGGLAIPAGGGRDDGDRLIAWLATHPRTAQFLCTKLVVRFVDETAPPAPVEACANAFLAGGGDLRAATRAVLSSPEFLDEARAGGKLKRPLQFVASLARASRMPVEGIDLPDSTYTLLDVLVRFLDLMGEPLYRAHPPTGFPDDSAHWASAGSFVSRLKLIDGIAAADLVLGIDWGTAGGSDAEIVDALVRRLLPGGVAPPTRHAVLAHLERYAIASTEIRAREAAVLLLSSPEFMQH
jgi:hypothetical protein